MVHHNRYKVVIHEQARADLANAMTSIIDFENVKKISYIEHLGKMKTRVTFGRKDCSFDSSWVFESDNIAYINFELDKPMLRLILK